MTALFPLFTTERLHLREILPTDLDRIFYFRSDDEINKYIKRLPQTREMAMAHIELLKENFTNDKGVTWGITKKDSDILIGSICLWNFSEDKKTTEVGYDLDPKFHGHGIMSEALKSVLEYGFKRGFNKIEAHTNYKNIASKTLLKRHGFIPKDNIKYTDNQDNEVYYLKR